MANRAQSDPTSSFDLLIRSLEAGAFVGMHIKISIGLSTVYRGNGIWTLVGERGQVWHIGGTWLPENSWVPSMTLVQVLDVARGFLHEQYDG